MMIVKFILTPVENYGDGVLWYRGSILGEGGFGRVYCASTYRSKSNLPRQMAVKSAKYPVSGSLQFEKSMFDELRGCPEIIQCFGDELTTSEHGDTIYNLLLEYASGGTLLDRINRSELDGLPEYEVKRYTWWILQGLRHIHALGYVHCDIKPENILLVGQDSANSTFKAKIADLGLAKKADTKKRQTKRRKTQLGSWRGTVCYLPPETLLEGVQEAPSDIWGLGCIVLAMLTGSPAWDADLTDGEIVHKIKRELPIIPGELSMEAKGFLKLCLARDPKDRCEAKSLMYHPFFKDFNTRAM